MMNTRRQSRAYSAIVRTFCSFPQVEEVIGALRLQTLPPQEIIVVDSGSPDDERARLRRIADAVIDYPPEPFNFAKAINLGVDRVTTASCLVISSHVVLDDVTLIEACVREMDFNDVGVFYICNTRRRRGTKCSVITAATFDGANGFSNACGFVPTHLVRGRRFREEVFACEDQEWAAWYLRERGGSVLRVSSSGVRYVNPRVNAVKKINEELAIALFVDRRRLSRVRIAWRFVRAAFYAVVGKWRKAECERVVASELWRARRRPPSRTSRYF